MKTRKKNHPYKAIIALIVLFHSVAIHSQIWSPLTTNISEHLKSCCFIDVNTGWVGGENGTIIKTTNGGTNWSPPLPTLTTETVRSIYFINSMEGWACGDNGMIIETTNGGTSWQPLTLAGIVTSQLNSVKFIDPLKGWVVGSGGTIQYTINGGNNWTASNGMPGGNIWGLSIIDSQNLWISANSERVSETNDGGANWMNTTLLPGGALTLNNDIYFTDATHGWLVNSNGVIRRNTTGNNLPTSWPGQISGTTNDLLSVDMVNNNFGWVCGRHGTIISTTNSGANWNGEASNQSGPLWQIDFVNDTTGWAVGDSGLVLKYQVDHDPAPLTLSQPNGGEIYQIGTSQFIIWHANGVNNVKIEYSVNGNSGPWTTIINSTPINTTSYSWTIPNTPSLNAYVKITDVANPMNADTSSNLFYIQPIPQGDDYAVLVSATSTNSPSQITLNWVPDANALTYSVDRKLKTDVNWTFLATVPVAANTYTDNTVNVGEAFEYRITKTTPQLTAYGYIYAGLELPETDFRGTALLLIDINFASALTSEIDQLELDLIGDGYRVVKNIVDPLIGVPAIKNIIVQEYINGDSALTTVLSIGHLPTAYSGNFAADGHSERIGAQPTDGFYGDVDGVWTDSFVTVVNSGIIYSPNVPGDGVYDTDSFPSAIELQVGRVDMHNMPGFSLSETGLLQQYFQKNHNYKLKVINPGQRALMNTTMDHNMPTTSASAWRSYYAMYASGIKELNTCYTGCTEFMDSLRLGSYMWTHMAGGGSDTSITNDVFSSYDCINNPINSVFMQLYGSYLLEWYKGSSYAFNNLLRAPLASNGTSLATVWSGKAPYWHFHHMALGETIGYSTVTNQNNLTTYTAGTPQLQKGIHMALMGDPTLKMHIVAPVSNLITIADTTSIDINWTASTDNVVGYNIYRADSLRGIFTKLNTSYITSTNYTDVSPIAGSSVYMVRAVKLDVGSSASYYNLSTGIIATAFIPLSNDPTIVQNNFSIYPNPSSDILNFSQELEKVEVYNAYGQKVMTTQLNSKYISVENLANGIYFIKSGNINKKFIVKH